MAKRYDLRSQAVPPADLNTTMIEDDDEPLGAEIQMSDILSNIQELVRSVTESRKEVEYLRNQITIANQRSEQSVSFPERITGDLPQQNVLPALSAVVSSDSTHKLYDLPPFSGLAEDWPLFIANFLETTDMYRYSNRQNLMRLQKGLQGLAREAVVSMLIYPNDVPKVIEELEFRFGRPDLLVRSQLMKIQQFPTINTKKMNQLVEFSTKVRNVVTFFNSANCAHHLMNATLLEELVAKLPMEQQFDWARYAIQIKPYPTLVDFSQWLSDLAKVVCLLPNSHQTMQPKQVMLIEDSKKMKCLICKEDHYIIKCQTFQNMNLETRWNKVKEFKLCFSCLRKGHGTTTCRIKKLCGINNCKRNHHKMLHDLSKNTPENNTKPIAVASNQLQPMLNCRTQQASILFKIFPVKISGPAGSLKVFAMFDEGSSISLIDEQTEHQIGLKGKSSPLTLQWYGDEVVTEKSFKVTFDVEGLQDTASRYVLNNVQTISKMNLPKQTFFKSAYPMLSSMPLEDYSNALPVILLGLDNSHLAVPSFIKEGNNIDPIAAYTKLGWVVYGPTNNYMHNPTVLTIKTDNMHNMIQEFFDTENFGSNPDAELLLSDENQYAKEIMERTTKRLGTQFETGLLWKKYPPNLPPSYEMAKKRLFTIERKMSQNPQFADKYNQEMNKYLQKGYARKLRDEEVHDLNFPIWYLPHFGVVNPHKPDKLRVVFDAAAKVGDVSLNSSLVRGPEQAKPLLGILMKFRQGIIAVAADIREMFSQVKIRYEDQHSQRFLWRNGDPSQPIHVYVMVSMTFGAICSPCSAEYTKNVNAMQFSKKFPDAATAIIEKHYVDDFVCSFNTEEEALKICKEVVYVHSQGGFELRGFVSNNNNIEAAMNNISEDDVTTIKMERQASTEKILGMYWNKQDDTFEFQTKFYCLTPDVLNGIRVPTKRELLKVAMAVFDPFGLIADFLLYSKVLVQSTWVKKMMWDDPIPEELHKKWKAWWNEFKEVRNFKIPRCISPKLTTSRNIQLHVFVDASQDAFAAVCYFRISHDEGIDVSFVFGKIRCAPKKLMSIPRLELQASVLGVRLAKSVKKNHDFKISSTNYWSNSQTVLRWINSQERRFKTFVSHRIAEILNSSSPEEWNWVPTDLNSADSGTRPVYPPKFNTQSKWILGPEFLKNDECDWPNYTLSMPNGSLEEELKPQLMVREREREFILFDYKRFSSYGKLKRTTAYVYRFLKNKRGYPNQLTVTELDIADKLICRKVQEECFPNEIEILKNSQCIPKSSPLYSLVPYIHEDGLLRVNGRLDEALYLPFDARRPIILPQNHKVSKLIAHQYHEKNHHQNILLTINEIRQRYWIPSIKSVLKSVIRECLVCRYDSAKPQQPIMGQLPPDRITPYVRAFTYTGVDLFGPFNVSIGRRREKRWAVIFTCLTVRAAHIEIAENLSTDAFILCFRNFINRRGTPVRMRSDNGTNFIGAQKLLKIEDRLLNVDSINNEAVKHNIEWIFNCPANPSSGGCWERLIRIIKRLLQKTLKETAPRVETLRSVLIEAENIINSRPLTDIPLSSKDEEPLTPNHFLMGCINSTQTHNISEEVCLRKQWRIALNLKDRLWKKWVKEYLPQLICRQKWLKAVDPLKPDDIVLISDSNLPRHQWVKGIVIKVYPSKDGQVRFADVKTINGITRRPSSKIAVLKVNLIDSRGEEM